MDPFSYDANVDCELFLSEYGDDKCCILPKACLLFSGRFDDGQWATAAETCGDGACSIH